MQLAQLLADLLDVGLAGVQLVAPLRAQQGQQLVVELVVELTQVRLALAAGLLQMLPFAGLRQAVAAVEQLRRAAEEAAVGQQLLQGAVGLGVAGAAGAAAEVVLLEVVLGLLHLAAVGRLLEQQQGGAGAQVGAGFPEVLSLAGLTYVLFAENYCGAVPVSTINDDGSFNFGGPLTVNQELDSAVGKFNLALAVTGAPLTATFKQLAQVGKGRALLDKGDYAGAAAAVAGVSTTFQYIYQHSETTAGQNNDDQEQ